MQENSGGRNCSSVRVGVLEQTVMVIVKDQ